MESKKMVIFFVITAVFINYAMENQLEDEISNISQKNAAAVEFLLASDYTGGINDVNKDGFTPLCAACAIPENNRVIRQLLNTGAEVNKKSLDGTTPLSIAVTKKEMSNVVILLTSGALVNATDNQGFTPLHSAVNAKASLECIRLLCAYRANVTAQCNKGYTPLHLAVMVLRRDIIKTLLEYAFRNNQLSKLLETTDYEEKKTAAQWAEQKEMMLSYILNQYTTGPISTSVVQSFVDQRLFKLINTSNESVLHEDHYNKVEALLRQGISVNVRDYQGRAPLFLAVHNPALVTLLIEYGADVNAENEKLRLTALHRSVMHHKKSVDLLLKHGSNVNKTDENGKTAIHWLAVNFNIDDADEKALLLLDHGGKINITDHLGNTPLFYAWDNGNNKLTNFFLSCVDPLKRCSLQTGLMPLHIAVSIGSEKLVEGLVATQNVDINVKDLNGITPLHKACEQGDTNIVQLLLRYGVRINQKDRKKRTALHYVAKKVQEKNFIRSLILAGAQIDAKDCDGNTPLHIAVEVGNVDAISELLLNGSKSINEQNKEGMTPYALAKRSNINEVITLLDMQKEVDSFIQELDS